MRLFNNDRVEVVLTPSEQEINAAISSARTLMKQKIDAWILDQLTIEQLECARDQIIAEIEKRQPQPKAALGGGEKDE